MIDVALEAIQVLAANKYIDLPRGDAIGSWPGWASI